MTWLALPSFMKSIFPNQMVPIDLLLQLKLLPFGPTGIKTLRLLGRISDVDRDHNHLRNGTL